MKALCNGIIARFLALFVVLCLAWPGLAFSAEDTVFTNNLGVAVKEIYGTAPGNAPWKLAGPLANGERASVKPELLRACGRVMVTFAGDAFYQFFTGVYLEGVPRVGLEWLKPFPRRPDRLPVLKIASDGGELAIPAGLSFHLLNGYMAQGMNEAGLTEWLNPLGLPGSHDLYAVALGNGSWNIVEKSAVFEDDGKKAARLVSLSLETLCNGEILMGLLNELMKADAEPLLLDVAGRERLAFAPAALEEVKDATLLEGMDKAESKERWAAFFERLGGMGQVMSELPENVEPVVKAVFASPAMRYELKIDFSEATAVLQIKRL